MAFRIAAFLSVFGVAAGAFAATTQTGGALFQYGAFATSNMCGAITLTGNSSTDSFDSSQGTYAATRQNTGGNIGTNGNIRLSGDVRVDGTASSPHSGAGACTNQSLTAVTSNGNASISGGIVLLAAPMIYANPPAPSPAPPTSNQNISGACGNISGCSPLSGSKNLGLAPGFYGNLSVSGGTTIHLQAGTYNINSLSLSGKSELALDSTPVLLNFAGQGLTGNDTAVDLTGGTISNPSGKPSGLEIVYAGAAAIKLSGGSASYGFVYAPKSRVTLGGGADWYGAIIASTVTDTGNSAIHYDRALGNIPLAITAKPDPAANAAGWNNTDVTVSFSCAGILVTACPAPVSVTAEGANQPVSGTTQDISGAAVTVNVAINLDKTPPVVAFSRLPLANAAGWNNTNVTVSFTGTDNLSGVAGCSAPTTLTNEGRNQSVSGACTDVAGNVAAPVTVAGINIDKTPPTLAFGPANPAANAAGWNNTNVNFPFTTADNLSGVAPTSVPSPLVLAAEGASVNGTVTVTDLAGNSATFTSPSVKIDKTPPVVAFGAAIPAANAAGWNNTNVNVPFTATDALSGLASTSAASPLLLTAEGSAVSGSVTVTDVAGNTTTYASPPVKIDKTPPTAQAAASPQANASSWNNTNVTVSFTGTDALSGVASCSMPVALSTEGRNESASGTCTDNAGNVSQPASVSGINIDKTPPTLTFGTATPAANTAGWNNTNAAFSFTTADNLSGVASTSVPSPLTLTTEGTSVSGTVTVTDVAGNSATFTSPSVKIDKTPPTLTFLAAAPPANAAGWNNTNVSFGFTTADNLSGVASTSIPSPLLLTTEGTSVSESVTVTDVAGNTATFTSSAVKIEKTPPAAQAAASPPPNPAGWNNTNVTVGFTGTNTISGITSCSAPVVLSTEERNQSASGTCTDNAGNVSQPASVSGINIDKTLPILTFGAATPAPNAAGWNNTNVAFSFTTADNLSGVASTSVPSPLVLSTEGTAVSGSITVTDVAGNSATFISPTVKIDKTPPILTFGPAMPAPNAAGWNNTDVCFTYTATDSLSGMLITIALFLPLCVTTEGSSVARSVTVTDVAGNAATFTSPSVRIDKTPPTAQAAASPQANAAAWNNTNVIVSFTGTDALSGIASCSPALTLNMEGKNQSASGTCTDNAGNLSQPASVSGINIDKTPPTVTITSPADKAVLNTPTVTVEGTIADSLSGVTTVACNGLPAVISAGSFTCRLNLFVGPNAISVQGKDVAGNTGFAAINVTVNTAPRPQLLVFTVQPPLQVKTGQVFFPATQVAVEDTSGAVLTTYNGPVIISIGSNPGGAILSGTLTQTAINGVANFADLGVNTAGNGYTLQAYAAGLTSTSNPFNVTLPPELASAAPAGSLSVLVQDKNVSSYVPNGNWESGINGIELVPIEGDGPRANISTPNVVNSCASNSVTGQTVCTANTRDVYLIKGSQVTATLQSSATFNTVPGGFLFSGGDCANCGVAINAVTNQAVIAMGLDPAIVNYSSLTGIQLLDLNTNTFASPIGTNSPVISEDIFVDPQRNLVLSASEQGAFEMFKLGPGGGVFDNSNPRCIDNCRAGYVLDATAEDVITGIALGSYEDSGDIYLADLTQGTFGYYSGQLITWTAPGQTVRLPEVNGPSSSSLVARGAIAVAPGSHLGVITSEFGGNSFAVFQLPSTSGSGVPTILDYAAGSIPADPSGVPWFYGGDPHTLTAYFSPTNGKPYGLVANTYGDPRTSDTRPSYLAVLDLQGLLSAPRSAAHIIDSSVDLVGAGLIRFVPVYAPPAQLVFISQPVNGFAGEPLLQSVQVAFEDAHGNINATASAKVTLTISNGANLVPSVADPIDGIATFANPTVDQPGTYTLTASSPGLPSVTSNPFSIAPAHTPSQLTFTMLPSIVNAGQTLLVEVAVEDTLGNVVTGASNLVTLSLGANPAGATLSGQFGGTRPSLGIAMFSVSINKIGSGYSFTASSPGLTSASSISFVVNPGAPSRLVFLTQPTSVAVNATMNPLQIAVEDNVGNVVSSASGVVSIALGGNPSGGTLAGTVSVSVMNGIATFSGLRIDKAGNGYSLFASISGFGPGGNAYVISDTFNVLPFTGPTIVSLSPSVAMQGTSLQVTITAQNTHFVAGTTTANFGPGVSVGSGLSGRFGAIQITSATTAIAQVSVAANATLGLRTVVVQTGPEEASLVNGFAVNGIPFLTYITPGSGQPGQTVSVTVKGVFTNFQQGLTQASFGAGISVGAGPAGGFGPVMITDAVTATAQLTISAAATPGLRPVMVQTGAEQASLQGSGFLVLSSVSGPPPIVSITSPVEGTEVTSPTVVTGTVTGPNLATWTLDYKASDSTSFTTFATGTSSMNVSGTFDPTLLLNGLAAIRLTAVDQSGQTTNAVIDVAVARKLKVGLFTVSFNDLTIPVAGIPIQITRTYDSRFKGPGDFGIGWTLSIKSMKVSVNGKLGMNWQGSTTGPPIAPTYCIAPTLNHLVTFRLPGDTLYQFQPVLTAGFIPPPSPPAPGCQTFMPLQTVDVSFTPVGATPPNATLTAINGTALFVFGTFPGVGNPPAEIQLVDSVTGEAFDPDQFQLTLPTGQTFLVSRTFGVQSVTDTNNNSLTITSAGITSSTGKGVSFQRDVQNRITSITDPMGNLLSYAYNSNGDLVTFTDQVKNVSTFTYDAAHDLLSYTDPRGVQPLRNVYDNSGRLIQQIDASGHVQDFSHHTATNTEAWTDFLGNITTYVYDNHGNVIGEIDPLGNVTSRTFDANDNVLSETSPLGKTTLYTYDSANNRVTETDPLGHTTTYTYNASNKVLTTKDPLGHVTIKSYDANGNVTSVKDAAGKLTIHTYDTDGLRTSTTDRKGATTTYAYDFAGNFTQQTDPLGNLTTYTYDFNGNRLSESKTRTTASGAETLVTNYQYDSQNRLVKRTYPDGSTTEIAYNSIGKQRAAIDQRGAQTSYQYDAMGRLLQTTYPDGTTESFTYDAVGDRITATDRAGRTTTFVYDPLKRLTQAIHSDTSATLTTYDAIGQVTSVKDALGSATQYQYDGAGRRTAMTDASGHVTVFGYDDAGNQISMTDANNNTTHYQYDALNRRTAVVYPDTTADTSVYDELGRPISKTDQAGKTMQSQYDPLGRLIQVTDAVGQITKYTYDEVGNRITQTDANNHTTTFAYDRLGRRIKRTLPVGMSETYAYDASGNLQSKTDFNGKITTYTYDSVNRLLTKVPDPSFGAPAVTFTYTPSGQRQSMADATGLTSYLYDLRDRLVSKATPQGTLSYSYDAAGNLLSIQSSNMNGASATYAYDQLNRLASVTDTRPGGGVTTYSYDAVGNLAGYTYPNGVQSTFTYNTLNRLTNLTVSRGAAIASYAYTLGAAGNRTSVAELGGRTVTYSYDSLYRLTNETIAGGTANGSVTYTYDPVGNRLSRTSTLPAVQSTVYAYDANDRLTTDNYDSDGNTTASGGNASTYDFENHLTSSNGGSVTILYDGDGNRASKTDGGTTTKYLVDDRNLTGYAQVLEEIVGGAVQRVYTYGPNRISQSQASGTSFYGYDGHGNVRLLTDTTGAVTDRYDYDAFGNIISQTGTTPNVYLYSGEQLDRSMGIYYLRARYYESDAGRFFTGDPFEGVITDPHGLHRYLYVGANPINLSDPTGRQTLSEESAAVSISSILATASRTFLTVGTWLYTRASGFWNLLLAAGNAATGVYSINTVAPALTPATSRDMIREALELLEHVPQNERAEVFRGFANQIATNVDGWYFSEQAWQAGELFIGPQVPTPAVFVDAAGNVTYGTVQAIIKPGVLTWEWLTVRKQF